ncbi:hypothetical protein H340_30613 [Streptomyces mobaraensis NBRC 13819 = DSM 40847]|uniref:Uncharacterized protein n=1 Tax=Streptomyces mobaraensis (strain ATCC 29032 / DSM 40847 / JCM 4168 / NBRC 13819 / NCIMB 11159 / IPCR 16-22) TaxID=1223523 RepID=M3ASP8_STRM1|nr:hypothetical protein H340_30613 [Streptomyces mobaraensis NBRC 13819 = DSM 40847]
MLFVKSTLLVFFTASESFSTVHCAASAQPLARAAAGSRAVAVSGGPLGALSVGDWQYWRAGPRMRSHGSDPALAEGEPLAPGLGVMLPPGLGVALVPGLGDVVLPGVGVGVGAANALAETSTAVVCTPARRAVSDRARR